MLILQVQCLVFVSLVAVGVLLCIEILIISFFKNIAQSLGS